jgi:hypothetical protein
MSVVDIFAALDNRRHIIVTCNNREEGWFFYDTDNPTDGEGDGMFYELPDDAAYAAAEFYGLLDEVSEYGQGSSATTVAETRTVTFTDAQVDLILAELRESNSADLFVVHNEEPEEEDLVDLNESIDRRNEVIGLLVASQL